MWLQLVSTITILAFFWTDLFSFLGKVGEVSYIFFLGRSFPSSFLLFSLIGILWDLLISNNVFVCWCQTLIWFLLFQAGSVERFQWMMSSGFACMFGFVLDTKCPAYVAAVSWPVVIFNVIFLVALVYLIITASDCSSPYIVGVVTLALPLSTLWWSFFVTGNILHWAPSFSGETGFTVVGFPIMVVSLVLYKYYTERERVQVI